jgi:hypothetical protein
LRARAATLEQEAFHLDREAMKAGPIPESIDVTALRGEIAEAETIKAAIEAHHRHDLLTAEAMHHEETSQKSTKAIEVLDAEREKAIAAAKMPVEGLTLGDGVVLYNGLPFEQAASSAKLKVSCAVAMAANPELRIIRTYDGSLLDRKSLAMLAAMAKSRDFQCWVERVDESGKIGFVIEDGELKGG